MRFFVAIFVRFFFVCDDEKVHLDVDIAMRAEPNDDATTRAHYADYVKHRDAHAIATRMRVYDAYDAPRDVRESIEGVVRVEEWRLAYARTKHLWQTRRERKRDLREACARLGCEVREDSVLCVNFVEAETFAGVKGEARARALEKWNAEAVARRVAEMRYIHEYCDEYRDTMKDARARVHEASEAKLRRTNGKKKWYYPVSKRDASAAWTSACEEVLGFKNIGAFARALVSNWTSFPDRWPWIKDDVDYAAAASDAVTSDDDDDDYDDDNDESDESYWYTDTDASYYDTDDDDDDYDYVVYELLSINLRS